MQPDHPDPSGVNLRRLASVLEEFLKAEGGTFAVFFDYGSLYQKDMAGTERAPSKQALFTRALTNMMDWYSQYRRAAANPGRPRTRPAHAAAL